MGEKTITMKKQLLTIVLAVGVLASVAQNNRTTLDTLTSYKWETSAFNEDSLVLNYFRVYTATTFKTTVVYADGDNIENNYQYYLSDRKETTFNTSKVGQVQYGKYMMVKNVSNGSVFCIRILELNDTEFYFIALVSAVGAGPLRLYASPK